MNQQVNIEAYLEDFRTEIRQLKATVDNLTAENTRLNRRIGALNAENNSLKRKIDMLTEENASLREKLSKYEDSTPEKHSGNSSGENGASPPSHECSKSPQGRLKPASNGAKKRSISVQFGQNRLKTPQKTEHIRSVSQRMHRIRPILAEKRSISVQWVKINSPLIKGLHLQNGAYPFTVSARRQRPP